MPRPFKGIVNDNGRECTICGIYKKRECFSFGNVRRKYPYSSTCKECHQRIVKGTQKDLYELKKEICQNTSSSKKVGI